MKRELIQILLNQSTITFHNADQEIQQLNELYWEDKGGGFSIVDEVIIYCDTFLAGYATSVAEGKERDWSSIYDELLMRDIVKIKGVSGWLTSEGEKYPCFVSHIVSIVCLRYSLIDYIKSRYLR